MDVKMFQMGFGESILLYDENSCLLVDCGSESKHRKSYFVNVSRELEKYSQRFLLLSHFHMDHMNGIRYLYDVYPQGFDMVYLPNVFKGETAVLEFIILQYLIDSKSQKSEAYQIWQLLGDIIHAQNSVQLICRGKDFDGPSGQFKALWPLDENPKVMTQWNAIQAAFSTAGFSIEKIVLIANKLRSAVQWIVSDSDFITKYRNAKENTDASYKMFLSLRAQYVTLLNATDKEHTMVRRKLKKLFKELKENEHSIVFHTSDDSALQILMTGDVTKDSMEEIANNTVIPFIPVKEHYDVLKAPHHGTESCYVDLTSYFNFDNLLISNGETTCSEKKRGKISKNYLVMGSNYNVYCSNTVNSRCELAPINSNEHHPNCCVCCRAGPLQIDI